MAAQIKAIEPGSIAEDLGIEAGDILVAINGNKVEDILDYDYYSGDDDINVEIQKGNEELWSIDIEKDYDEDLGIIFDDIVFNKMKYCKNHCVFCFIDQMPHKMRRTLYIKDDDYRYSFLYGNFITLTNLKEQDWEKIEKMRLSPLYVSVHAIQEDVRVRLMGTQRAAGIKNDLKRLSNAGIEIHTQIVLCPGINDGDMLVETVEELACMYPSVQSIGIVPVGLTGHRDGLPALDMVKREKAMEVIAQVEQWQKSYREKIGSGMVYLADEFYLKAGVEVPADSYYDDYPQIENGIGLCRLLLDEFTDIEASLPGSTEPSESYIITGESAVPVLSPMVDRLNQISGVKSQIIPVKNGFFAGGVTVTGLLVGQDIINTLGNKYKDKKVIIPEVVFREGKEILLDDMMLEDIERASQADIRTVDGTASSLVNAVLNR